MSRIAVYRDGALLAERSAKGEVQLLYRGAYQPGDEIVFESDFARAVARVDQTVAPARLYLPTKRFVYRPPMAGDGLAPYAPGAFQGEAHLLSLCEDTSDEYRDLAENPADQRGDVDAYPHATANVETRDESVFAARNVLDGLRIATGHGEWPYGSWGVGKRTDAELTLHFGREVEIDAMDLYLRADFPHDAYWLKGMVTLSDGYEAAFPLRGEDGAQRVPLGKHKVTWLRLHGMVKCDMPSAFPALRALRVWGRG